MKLWFYKITTLLLFLGTSAFAHPVSYKDAIGLMSYNTPK